jgi:transcriptional regulator with XRE-family HTH domain
MAHRDLPPYGPPVRALIMSVMTPTSPSGPSVADPRGPGDLARRIIYRQNELGISTEDLAQRAGIDPTYLKYFEKSADARLSAGTLNLIAFTLDTSPLALQGGDFERPMAQGRAGRHPSLEALTEEHCEAHLAAGGVGRVVYSTERGPVALPVNFEFTDGYIVLSTDLAKAHYLEQQTVVGFEIDRVDEAMSEGWSVLVSGQARRVDDPDEVLRLSSLDLEPWAGGPRHALVKITPVTITGRVIVHNAMMDED